MSIRFEMQLFSRDEYAELSPNEQLAYLERMIKNLEALLGEARAQQDCAKRLASLRRSDGVVGIVPATALSRHTH
jgi:hypothetical protein